MGLDRTRWPELLVGLERVRVLEVARDGDGRLHVAIETTDEVVACGQCGVRAQVKDRGAAREVGAEVHTVTYIARQLGVAWHTVMDAVACWGQPVIDDPNRVGQKTALGVDETKFLAARRREPTRWVSAICDVEERTVVDVIEGRQAPDLEAWLASQPGPWRQSIKITVTDLHEPFRAALREHLPNATSVADAFHVVGSGPGWSTAPVAGCS